MRLLSWNVNGLRAVWRKGFTSFVRADKPDILCLQEVKVQAQQLNWEIANFEDYRFYLNAAVRPGYSGTAIYTRMEPLRVVYGMGQPQYDQEGRVITCEFERYYLVNVYVPNSKSDLSRLEYRQQWDKDFLHYLKFLERSKPLIVCGDFNVAHQEIDLANPKGKQHSNGFTPQERDGFDTFLRQGFIDIFRKLHPGEIAYSWWSNLAQSRSRNVGWRIDYFLISPSLLPQVRESFMLPQVMGSDHCPVGIEIEF